MDYTVISSRSNDRVKYINRLMSGSSHRRAESCFVLEGARLCADAVRSGYAPKELYLTEKALEKYRDILADTLSACNKVYIITDDIASKLSDTVSSQGVFALVAIREQRSLELKEGGKYVALEDIQNPQNLGSVARTAEAFGITALIVSGGCDIYNSKALRASMGSLMRIPVWQTDNLSGVIKEAAEKGMLTVSTVPDSTAEDITALDFSKGALCVIGNEGNGVSEEIKSLTAVRATIRMQGEAESLNASAAATVAMWEMVR